METLEIFVENIKCSGCINRIKNALKAFSDVKSVEILLEEEKVIIHGKNLNKSIFVTKLDRMGYPEKGNNTFLKEAKSYVSCAIGKVSA